MIEIFRPPALQTSIFLKGESPVIFIVDYLADVLKKYGLKKILC